MNPTNQSKQEELREQLIEAIDDKRFDDDYNGGLHKSNAYVVDVLLPLIQSHDEAKLDWEKFRQAGVNAINSIPANAVLGKDYSLFDIVVKLYDELTTHPNENGEE